ncbi:L,D-transpeptidase family protein [Pseudomarimonas arenosa]|uniref:L,D-transpeptidase family protein n=1 Tax=Pseudomarimonas arenosa TaxID=2774145 RepID=A0AAW3ZMM3_9GAMM|nr:L,D-transpeptidase family protein [Pseudomarimonas arenosa]MBD8525641.1 L,D-transpeptidase family protein [Pseudomarimonas arenosa]
MRTFKRQPARISGLRIGLLIGLIAGLAMAVGGWWPVEARGFTVEQRLDQFGAAAQERLQVHYRAAGVRWPGERAALLAFKDQASLELHVQDEQNRWQFVRRYPILAASGGPGPKLREGDYQVPEGFYRVSFLNANSRFHVSLRLDYPNAFDRQMAAREGRSGLGGDIMIHGSRVSVGCLAMGDPTAEELFTLAASIGMDKLEVLIAPQDFRQTSLPSRTSPVWLLALYEDLQRSLQRFFSPPSEQ